MAKARKCERNIGFRAADTNVEACTLEQQLAAWRRQAEQQFAEAHNSRH